MKKKSSRSAAAFAAALTLAIVFSLAGCGKTENTDSQADQEAASGHTDAEVLTDMDAARTQNAGQDEKIDGMMRAYSDTEKDRMAKLQQSYQEETAKPEKMVKEVDSAEEVTDGVLSYIRSTGEYYLPDRELTDEELLEIIDCNFRIALHTNRKTKEEYDAEDCEKRAMLEEEVQEAGGISETEAVEVAKKAMKADLGEAERGMKLRMYDEEKGWSAELCVADWSEIKEKDRGAIAYTVQFDLGDDTEDWTCYRCTINAADGSILEAYKMEFTPDDVFVSNTVYYEH